MAWAGDDGNGDDDGLLGSVCFISMWCHVLVMKVMMVMVMMMVC